MQLQLGTFTIVVLLIGVQHKRTINTCYSNYMWPDWNKGPLVKHLKQLFLYTYRCYIYTTITVCILYVFEVFIVPSFYKSSHKCFIRSGPLLQIGLHIIWTGIEIIVWYNSVFKMKLTRDCACNVENGIDKEPSHFFSNLWWTLVPLCLTSLQRYRHL